MQSVSELAGAAPQTGKAGTGKPALKVWSYEIPATAKNKAFAQKMPAGARILKVDRGTQMAQLFALVNPEMPEEERLFYVAGTNFPLPDPEPQFKALAYVDSYNGWGQWWHVFEIEQWDEPGSRG